MGANTNPDSAPTAVRYPADSTSGSADVRAGWVLLLGFTLLYGAVSLVYPFGRDQATYAFMGNAILHGMTLYRDVPWGLPPMTALAHALAFLLFGRTMIAIRILDLLWTLATVGVLSMFVTKAFQRRWAGVIAGLIYSLIYYSIGFWNTAQVDGFLNLPVVLALYLLTRTSDRTSPGVWFSVGMLTGVALFFKYTMGMLVPGIALALVLAPGRRSGDKWRAAAWFCGGCLATGVAGFGIIYLSGALPAFVRLLLGAILPYSRLAQRHSDAAFPICLLGIPSLITALGLTLAKRRELTPNPAPGGALILVWLAASLASVLAQGKFFIAYHYLPGLPPLAVFGTFVIAAVLRPLTRHFDSTWRRVGLLTLALTGLAVAANYPERLVDLARVASNRLSLRDLWSRPEFSGGKFSVSENLALAEYLKEHTSPEDRLANFGIDPPFTFPTWHEPVLRFTSTTGIDPASWKLPAEFRANPPDVLTVKHGERLPWVWVGNRDAYEQLMAFTELRGLVAARYELEARLGHFDILCLMNSDSVMPVPGDSLRLLSEDLSEALDWLNARAASARDSGFGSIRTVLWPRRVPDNLDFALSAKMVSHKTANRALWLEEKKPDDLLPALSVWIANDDRPFARQDPFSRQGEGKDYDAGGLSFVVRHRCRNGLVFIYDVRRTPAP